MNSKYIIKNCPAILKMTKVCDAYETTRDLPQFCKDCTDCLLKQIVELCKKQTQSCKDCPTWTCEDCNFSTNGFAEEVIELLDIQEVDTKAELF